MATYVRALVIIAMVFSALTLADLASARGIRIDNPGAGGNGDCQLANWTTNGAPGSTTADGYSSVASITPGGVTGAPTYSCYSSGTDDAFPNSVSPTDPSSIFITNDQVTPFVVATNGAFTSSPGWLASSGELYEWTGLLTNDSSPADFQAIIWTLGETTLTGTEGLFELSSTPHLSSPAGVCPRVTRPR